MSNIKLNFACGLYDRMLPLYTGEVQPEGIDLNFIAIDSPRDIFDRMASRQEFDVSEFSASELICRLAVQQSPFVAIPVFPSRVFRHGMITINQRSGIKTAKDLEGKRVGVPLYTMTAAVWIRGHLQHEYGVDLSRIHWIQGAINHAGAHGEPATMPLCRPVRIELSDTEKTLSDLLEAGELDAIIGTSLPKAIHHNPDIRRLFPNYRRIEREFYCRTGIFPIMHFLVLRREVHEKHDFVAASLYRACCAAKRRQLEKMYDTRALQYMLPWMSADLDEIDKIFGGDPWPYGVGPNRATLEALLIYLEEQAMIPSSLKIKDIFVLDGETDA